MKTIYRYNLEKEKKTVEKIRLLLLGHFKGDKDKVELWAKTKNPLLGGVSPDYMLCCGRSEKLLKFVRNQIEENKQEKE